HQPQGEPSQTQKIAAQNSKFQPPNSEETRNPNIRIAPAAAFNFRLHILRIGPNREHEEQRAQDVFALCSPGNRFYVQRVQGKKCGNKKTAPWATGQSGKEQKKQD